MAKVPMKRVEIIALMSDCKSVIERLQRRGVVELLQRDPNDQRQGIEQVSTVQSVNLFEKNKAVIQQALAVMEEYLPSKASMLSSLSPRKSITTDEFGDMAALVEKDIRQAHEVLALVRKIEENRTAIISKQNAINSFRVWQELDLPMRFSGTEETSAFVGTLPGLYDKSKLIEALQADLQQPIAIEAEVIFASREHSGIFVLCHRSIASDCEQVLRKLGFALPQNTAKVPPSDEIERYSREIQQLEKITSGLVEKIKDKKDLKQKLQFAMDYLSMRQDKYRALEELSMTRNTIIIQGYIPSESAQALVDELQERYTIVVTLFDPAEDEDAPVAFKNRVPAAALEDITSSYSMPSKDDIDPNAAMAFFYYLFFGLMLSDAGYGLLLVIATGFILRFIKPEGQTKRNMQKFLLCGLSTVFWGALFGSWFGNIVSVVSTNFFGKQITLAPIWFDPVTNPMKLLIFSLILGFFQVMAGLALKFYILWKSGQRLDALLDIGLWWVVFAGILVILAGMMNITTLPLNKIGIYIAVAGGAGLVLTQGRSSKNIAGKILGGVASLYSITGYFSDILSYCRLMALGLVTGIIGSVVNTIGAMNGGGFGSAIMLILVFIVGHSINLGINVLGAYVHCNRLQYVEFFSKFYEGGGKPYTPFQVNTAHYKFKEENNHV